MVRAEQEGGSFAYRGCKEQGRITAWHSLSRAGCHTPGCSHRSPGQGLFGCCLSCPDPVTLALQGCSVLLLCPCSPPHLAPREENAAGVRIPLRMNSRDISLSLVWNLDFQFSCWCWDLCSWDSPTSHSKAPNTCFCVWLQRGLMVRNGNIRETGTVLMENGQALKKRRVFLLMIIPRSAGHFSESRLLRSGIENCNEKDILTLLFTCQNKPLQNVLKKNCEFPQNLFW